MRLSFQDDGWTRGVEWGDPGGSREEFGVIAHVLVPVQSARDDVAELTCGFSQALEMPETTRIIAGTFEARDDHRIRLSGLDGESLKAVIPPEVSFMIIGSGLNVGVQRVENRDRFSVGIVMSCRREDTDAAVLLGAAFDVFQNLPSDVELLSAGLEVALKVDTQGLRVFPNPRVDGNWVWHADNGFSCGYYWLTMLGPSLLEKLPAVPEHFDASWFGDNVAIRAGSNPEDDATIRSHLPAIREWMRPVLGGWMVGRPTAFDLRLFEGPPLPQAPARSIGAFIDKAAIAVVSGRVETGLGITIPSSGEFTVTLELQPVEGREVYASEGLEGVLSAVERGIDGGWIAADKIPEVTVDGFRITATGDRASLVPLIAGLEALAYGFELRSLDGPIRVYDSISVESS